MDFFFSLLYCKLEKKDKDELVDRDKEKLKWRKVDRTRANWVPGFLVYAVVVSRS